MRQESTGFLVGFCRTLSEVLKWTIVKLIECPRDAWQGLPKMIPAELKADYLRALIAAGFRHIDAVSFVTEAAVPQMATRSGCWG